MRSIVYVSLFVAWWFAATFYNVAVGATVTIIKRLFSLGEARLPFQRTLTQVLHVHMCRILQYQDSGPHLRWYLFGSVHWLRVALSWVKTSTNNCTGVWKIAQTTGMIISVLWLKQKLCHFLIQKPYYCSQWSPFGSQTVTFFKNLHHMINKNQQNCQRFKRQTQTKGKLCSLNLETRYKAINFTSISNFCLCTSYLFVGYHSLMLPCWSQLREHR